MCLVAVKTLFIPNNVKYNLVMLVDATPIYDH